MVIEKLAAGVVQLQTPIGPRYVVPSFWQRAYFLWVFRNFPVLPHVVLSKRQQRMIDQLCSEQIFTSRPYIEGTDAAPVIGIVERRPVMGSQPVPAKRPAATDPSGLTAEASQQP